MANSTKPLTSTEVSNAKPKEKEYNLSDGRGLQLRIKPNGSKLWLFNYTRPVSKKRANLSIGAFPDISLAEARKARERSRELLAKGVDPQLQSKKELENKQAAAGNTLKVVADNWFEVKKHNVSAKHAQNIYRRFELNIFPELGNVPIGD
ncbi:integrase arm-type DNA-binding domain-containing protein [Shewanella sp. WPAGA9]|uniref:integrase arm-type DNA-binding domain-containing protein n=1 Tax=Shewanella sp. ENK2 TaxID=2775245 RepID=UPI00298C69FD|nr:integrase arm-type DNA-binding domain-containing protein [Shewanella sp. WPAGA9]